MNNSNSIKVQAEIKRDEIMLVYAECGHHNDDINIDQAGIQRLGRLPLHESIQKSTLSKGYLSYSRKE
jgi:hypothetical protein